jgi:tRNA nucleotidyltransferase (CCA-adding enzyme)
VRDIEARVLRHVSDAFVEDPVRVLRVARFAARFAPLGFTVADETMALMQTDGARWRGGSSGAGTRMGGNAQGADRSAALGAFVRVLRECGALAVLFPEIDALYGVPQRAEFHPEIDTGVHLEMVLDAAARIAPGNDLVGFCALVHDLGKALTPVDELPRHVGHEHRGVATTASAGRTLEGTHRTCRAGRAGVPRAFERASRVRAEAGHGAEAAERAGCLASTRGWSIFLAACEADKRGRLGHESDAYPQAAYLREARALRHPSMPAAFVEQGLVGPAIGKAMDAARVEAIH